MAVPQSKFDLQDPVSRHMRKDVIRLQVGQTVGAALDAARQQSTTGRIIYFYVLDDAGRLVGVVPTRRLLLSPLEQPIADIMVKPVIALPADATVLNACEFFTLHRLLALPIVDDQRRLLGVIDVELYTDELTDLEAKAQSDDLFQLIGVHVAQARLGSPWRAFGLRFPWLTCNLTGGIAAAFLASLFEVELDRVVQLALFVPVVLALAESVSIQSATLALQALHGGRPSLAKLLPQLRREALVGLLLGGASGLVVALVALGWLRMPRVALCLVGGITGGVTCAALFGLAIPFLLRWLQRDPRVAAGPIALAAADLATLLLYFNLARWLT